MTADQSKKSKASTTPTVPTAVLGVPTHPTVKQAKDYLLGLAKSKVQASLAVFFHYTNMKDATIDKGCAVLALPRSQYGHLKAQGETIMACGPTVTAKQAEDIISVGTYGGSLTALRKALKDCETTTARSAAIKAALEAAKDKKKAGTVTPPTGEAEASGIQTEQAPEKKATDSSRLESAATVLAAVKGGGKPKPEDVANLSVIAAHLARIVESYNLTPADLAAATA